jgi:hypothetical protein
MDTAAAVHEQQSSYITGSFLTADDYTGDLSATCIAILENVANSTKGELSDHCETLFI